MIDILIGRAQMLGSALRLSTGRRLYGRASTHQTSGRDQRHANHSRSEDAWTTARRGTRAAAAYGGRTGEHGDEVVYDWAVRTSAVE
ncbi:hypothetical protein [Nocardia fusca]|uniref:hypothetical protein n=1 Tax=Nocardia fusca TaxID=941183 RepID=UPI0012F50D75|nr:hypothetical protein [Nocardia fusca]